MAKISLFPLLLVSAALFASDISQQEMQAVQKGNAASAALLQKLGGELTAHMQNGGPIAALQFCSQNALHLTDQIAQEHNLSIRRVSLKNRNPLNTPSAEEKSIMERWGKMQESVTPLPPYELNTKGESVSYYKPIVINKEACLKCHGDIAENTPVFKGIKELYPEDKATGYKMGDLRGMIVVTIPKK